MTASSDPHSLSFLRRLLSPERLERLRSGLSTSANIDVVTVSRFLYTTQGEAILQWLGELIQTQERQNGALGIRGSLILAAADPDGGLNALNVLKHFPTQGGTGRFANPVRHSQSCHEPNQPNQSSNNTNS